MILIIDLETRSRCDLKAHGVYNYAASESTEVLCMAYVFDDEDVLLWEPSQLFPARVIRHILDGGKLHAFNAAFERLMFEYVICNDYDVPVPTLSQWVCVAATARANCCPGNLADVGRFLGTGMQKDFSGSRLIRALCVPRHDGTFNNDPALLAELYSYCCQDVRTTRAITKVLRALTPDEQKDYEINEIINGRGVLVDVELAEAAMRYAAAELEDLQKLVRETTDGAIVSIRSPRMREWVQARVGDEALKLMTVHKDGVARMSIDKTVRLNLLAMDDPEQVPPDVVTVIECADALWASSVAKFGRMTQLADEEDHRARGAFVFAGGAATGRAASYGIQFQNMSRKCADDPVAVRQAMVRGHSIAPQFGPRVTDVLRRMIRPALIPAPGNVFVDADWSQIEARVTPWLADADDILDVFRSGQDIYVKAAEGIFHTTEVTPNQRSVGKAASLSCGFGGGHKAFAAMGKIYGVNLPEDEAQRTVAAWRRANPWAVRMWYDLENAVATALRHRGHEIKAAKTTYMFDGATLWYMLPSGRVLCYPGAQFEEDGISYKKAAWKPAAGDPEWPRAKLYRSVLLENIVQATAHDLLRIALRRMEDEGLAVIAHIHDEVLLECKREVADAVLARVTEIMCTPPEWCKTLPLEIEAKVMERFGK